MRPLVALAFAMSCNTTAPPVVVPTTVITPTLVEAGTASAECSAACKIAHASCANPQPLEHCLAVCPVALGNLVNPGASCIALTLTCNSACP